MLDGAKALALPTTGGQYLDIEPFEGNTIIWKSYTADGLAWYKEELSIAAIRQNEQHSAQPETNILIKILHEAWLANPEILEASGFTVTTRLTFPREWGLGTSSTLINNIAQWFNIDAFTLLAKSFGGSGYDIACAQNNTAIVYQLDRGTPVTKPVQFDPQFAANLYFVYLNRKQNSREAIARYRELKQAIAPVIAKIDAITQKMVLAATLNDFCKLIDEHESIMSGVLGLPTIKQLVFPDFNGSIKSLGAWGGDFVLAAAAENPEIYFKSKGFETVIAYNEMILGQKD